MCTETHNVKLGYNLISKGRLPSWRGVFIVFCSRVQHSQTLTPTRRQQILSTAEISWLSRQHKWKAPSHLHQERPPT